MNRAQGNTLESKRQTHRDILHDKMLRPMECFLKETPTGTFQKHAPGGKIETVVVEKTWQRPRGRRSRRWMDYLRDDMEVMDIEQNSSRMADLASQKD